MKIYVIMGTTGEYSDRKEWPLLAVRGQEEAERVVEAASREANRIQALIGDNPRYSNRRDELIATNAIDPNFKMDYTGTGYFFYEVELRDDPARALTDQEILGLPAYSGEPLIKSR